MKKSELIPKMESIILVSVFISILIGRISPPYMEWLLKIKLELGIYFTDGRLSMIANSAFILIGVYATITSVFGSSNSMATSRLAEKDLSGYFIRGVILAISSVLILAFYIIFVNNSDEFVLLYLMIWAFISLIRFLGMILVMYDYNVKNSRKADDIQKNNYEKMMDSLIDIHIELKKMNLKD